MSIISPEKPTSSNGLQVGMKVQIIGERGTFLVTFLDQRRHTADPI
jgi:hypothetical protein